MGRPLHESAGDAGNLAGVVQGFDPLKLAVERLPIHAGQVGIEAIGHLLDVWHALISVPVWLFDEKEIITGRDESKGVRQNKITHREVTRFAPGLTS